MGQDLTLCYAYYTGPALGLISEPRPTSGYNANVWQILCVDVTTEISIAASQTIPD